MKWKLFLFLMLSLWFFAGCWDQKIIEQTGAVLQLGVELSPENRLLVTSIYPAFDSRIPNRDEIITTEADLLREAREKTRMVAAKKVEGGKIQQIFFSKAIAAQGIQNLLEVFERDPLNPPLAEIVIVDGSPKELLERAQTFAAKPRAVLYLDQLQANNANLSYIPETRMYDFIIRYLAPGLDPVTPLFKLEPDGIKVLGSALFADDKMVGELNTQQTGFLLTMMGQAPQTEFGFISSGGQRESQPKREGVKKGIFLTITSSRRRIRPAMKNQRPLIDISLNFQGTLDEYHRDMLDEARVQKDLENQLAEEIKEICQNIFAYMQEIGSDPLGIGDLVRAKHYADWKKMDWRESYRNAEVNITVKLDILQYGTIK